MKVARGQAAEVDLGAHGIWTARVVSAFGERVVVALLAQPSIDEERLAGTSVQLAVTTARGLLRAPAVVLSADEDGLLEVDLGDETELDQRREHVRVESRLPTAIEPADAAHAPVHTYTLDVSGGGVLVAGIGVAEASAPVEVTLKVPGRTTIEAGGHVARRTVEGHAGVVFERIAPHDREELVRWIFERQRMARAEENGLL